MCGCTLRASARSAFPGTPVFAPGLTASTRGGRGDGNCPPRTGPEYPAQRVTMSRAIIGRSIQPGRIHPGDRRCVVRIVRAAPGGTPRIEVAGRRVFPLPWAKSRRQGKPPAARGSFGYATGSSGRGKRTRRAGRRARDIHGGLRRGRSVAEPRRRQWGPQNPKTPKPLKCNNYVRKMNLI